MAFVLAACGIGAGLAHAAWLRRGAEGRGHGGAMVGRMLLVGAVLVLAARSGHVIAGAAGWALGFVVTAIWIARQRS